MKGVMMFEKLESVEEKYLQLTKEIADPEIISDQQKWQRLMKEHAHMEPIVKKYKAYRQTEKAVQESQEMLADKSIDADFKAMCEEEIKTQSARQKQLEKDLKILLIPKDPNDDKNVIVEIRAGAGGDEAALFAHDLFRMYVRYAERHRWQTEILNSNVLDLGGIKEITFSITGQGAIQPVKIRKRCSSCTARSRNGIRRPNSHVNSNSCRIAGSRRRGSGCGSKRFENRCLPCIRKWRTMC
jgi:peptide chain release factor 1